MAIIGALMGLTASQGYRPNPASPYPNQYNQNRGNNYRPDARYQDIQNLRTENDNDGEGNYNYFYENTDGTMASQKGFLKAPRSLDDAPTQAAEGFYQYYSPEGQLIRVDYTADENGFQATGISVH